MATTSYGTPYVQSSDLVSGWPNASLNVANRIDQVSYAGNGINAQTVTSYTLAVTDAGKLVTLNNAAAVAVSLPQDSTANLPVGSVTRIYNLGAGLVTVQAGSGATLQGGSVTVAQYDACDVTKLSANTYGIAAKAALAGATYTGTHNFTSATVTGIPYGLVPITSVDVTASQTSLNNVFTGTYTQYVLQINAGADAADRYIYLKMRLSGTDSSASYDTSLYGINTTAGAGVSNAINGGANGVLLMRAGTGGRSMATVQIVRPAVADHTLFTIANVCNIDTTVFGQAGGGRHVVQTAYDGCTIYAASGSWTGNVKVWGVRNP